VLILDTWRKKRPKFQKSKSNLSVRLPVVLATLRGSGSVRWPEI